MTQPSDPDGPENSRPTRTEAQGAQGAPDAHSATPPEPEPEPDRRRDPRADPALLDLGSVLETDGDSADGWAEAITDSDPRHPAGGPDDPADWTEWIAPETGRER